MADTVKMSWPVTENASFNECAGTLSGTVKCRISGSIYSHFNYILIQSILTNAKIYSGTNNACANTNFFSINVEIEWIFLIAHQIDSSIDIFIIILPSIFLD